MDKKLQDLAWSVLPKEFKEEVKRIWNVECDCVAKYKSELHKHRTGLLYEIFGEHLHNLASDAEGEDEMLTCNKESVCKFYVHLLDMVENERMSEHFTEWRDLESEYIALFGEMVFIEYFGTKNPPDDETNPAELSAAHPDRLHIATQLLAGLLASGEEKHPVSRAVALADALIAECEKGDAE